MFFFFSRNLNYFATKPSPTEMLLLYFETISEIKAYDLIKSNTSSPTKTTIYDNSNSNSNSSEDVSSTSSSNLSIDLIRNNKHDITSSQNDNLFHKFFLNCFLDVIKANDDLIKLIYNDNLFN